MIAASSMGEFQIGRLLARHDMEPDADRLDRLLRIRIERSIIKTVEMRIFLDVFPEEMIEKCADAHADYLTAGPGRLV